MEMPNSLQPLLHSCISMYRYSWISGDHSTQKELITLFFKQLHKIVKQMILVIAHQKHCLSLNFPKDICQKTILQKAQKSYYKCRRRDSEVRFLPRLALLWSKLHTMMADVGTTFQSLPCKESSRNKNALEAVTNSNSNYQFLYFVVFNKPPFNSN